MQNLASKDNKLVRNFAMKNDKKDEFFHSSAYGTAQNAGNIGSASTGMTMAERKRIEERRKFVQKYNTSSLFEETLNVRHANKVATVDSEQPATETFDVRTHNRENVVGDADGNVRTSFGRTPGNGDGTIGIGGGVGKPGERSGFSGYTPFKTGGPSAPSRPSPAASFRADIKPSFK